MTAEFLNPLPGVPIVESPFFAQLLDQLNVDDETRRIATDLHENGVAVFDFPDPDVVAAADRIIADLTPRYDWEPWNERHESIRLMDEWSRHEDVRRLAVNDSVMSLLATIYGRRPIPFQTLNFPVGTQQAFHSDCCHFHCVPQRFMCGVWVALEDIDANNGPLIYYPRSHRLPVYTHEEMGCYAPGDQLLYEPIWRALVAEHGLEPQEMHLAKGQAVMWAANVLHGGAQQVDKSRTRHSQVTHYYFDNCVYYMPHHSDPFNGAIRFKEVHNIATGEIEPNRYVGRELPERFVEVTSSDWSYCAEHMNETDMFLPDDFDPAAYFAANPDVAASGMSAAFHYKRFGRWEGRRLR